MEIAGVSLSKKIVHVKKKKKTLKKFVIVRQQS